MTLPLLNPALRPLADGYSVTHGTGLLTAQLDGGPARSRAGKIGARSIANVSWALTPDKYAYLMAFFRQATKYGLLPFMMQLIIDGPDIAWYEVRIVDGSFALNEQSGHRYVVGCQLTVKKVEADVSAEYDNAVIMIHDTYGDDYTLVFNGLDQLVNQDLP